MIRPPGRPNHTGSTQDLRLAEHIDDAPARGSASAASLLAEGNALARGRRYGEALAYYDRALAHNPDFVAVMFNRCSVLLMLDRYEEALEAIDDALIARKDSPMLLTDRGTALKGLKRHQEALDSFDRALSIKPDYALALGDRGVTLEEMLHFDEALASYDKALAINGDLASIHFNASMCRLRLGDFETGWKEYEWRWKAENFRARRREFPKPLWLGSESLAGKAILLYAEQGLGDTIQFSRYVAEVAAKGAMVFLEVQPPLKSLFSGMSGVAQVLAYGEQLPEFDFQCPLMSLPLAFNTRIESIPPPSPSVSRPTAAEIEEWERKLRRNGSLTVGIVWSGNFKHRRDNERSIPLARLTSLQIPGVQLVSLQIAVRPEDAGTLKGNPEIAHFGSALQDFIDTAALLSVMDLVISVDTSVAHLAGTMGKPVWILLPACGDWRWLLNREDSPWYPTARLFRQNKAGDWNDVIASVKRALTALAHEASPGADGNA